MTQPNVLPSDREQAEIDKIVETVSTNFRNELREIMKRDPSHIDLITGRPIEPWAQQYLARHRDASVRELVEAAFRAGYDAALDHADPPGPIFYSGTVNEAWAAYAALTPAPQAAEGAWQPIETAPKDGTEIVLYGLYPENTQGLPTQRVTAGFWCEPEPRKVGDCGGECRCPEYADPEDPFWCSMHGGSDSGWMSADGGFTTEWPPTHWQPLPAPPAAAIRGGAE